MGIGMVLLNLLQQNITAELYTVCTNQQPPRRGGAVPETRLAWVEMAVGLPEGPSYPGHSPSFFAILPMNDRRRAAYSFFKIGRLFSLFLFYCPSSSPSPSSFLEER